MGNTKQRTIILDVIQNSKKHLTAEEIYTLGKEIFENLSIATVYRNLNILADNRIIKRIFIPNESTLYDKNTKPHDHLFCIKCGKVTDIEINESILSKNLYNKKIKVLDHMLVISCICEDCLKDFKCS